MPSPFTPFALHHLKLANRIVMSGMTRSRASGPDALASDLMATYYAQRAAAGLIITEGTQPSAIGQGHPNTPGLHSTAQVKAWRKVTDAVHAEGGVIFAQLMHAGRLSDPDLLPEGTSPVGPSAVPASGEMYTPAGPKPYVTPREMTEGDIAETISDFARAARNAMQAGFDGVEVHGAFGYLLSQFLSSNANWRTDKWGGSIEGRTRLTIEVVTAVAREIGADRVGLRISPATVLNDVVEEDVKELYEHLVRGIDALGLAYLHIAELPGQRALTKTLREQWSGALLLNPGTAPEPTGPAELTLIEDGTADMISYGALFLANPDLPRRLRAGGPFNTPDPAKFYGGDHTGYTDYPRLETTGSTDGG
ncbi:alkene reductase [Streptomyces violaceusniger]|uniref:Alkene reductase n=1 Tax=Streptomyces violaceusniger TaxID=68280 RepID=A0A4D4L534_STRVO|nr:alkene reductase [Streptomyces violaceusniger]